MSKSDWTKAREVIQRSRANIGKLREVVAKEPANWRLAAQVDEANDKRLDFEGRMIERQAEQFYLQRQYGEGWPEDQYA